MKSPVPNLVGMTILLSSSVRSSSFSSPTRLFGRPPTTTADRLSLLVRGGDDATINVELNTSSAAQAFEQPTSSSSSSSSSSATALAMTDVSGGTVEEPSTSLETPAGPEAYIIIEATLKKSELARFGSYASKVQSLVSSFGGEYIVQGGKHEPLEGEWGSTRIVVSKWPNADMARAFWNSDKYKELKKIREGTGEFRIMLLEGLESTSI